MSDRTRGPAGAATRKRWRLALLPLSWLLAAQGPAAPPAPTPEDAFLPSWTALPDHSGWRMLVSPAFPHAWPPPATGGAAVVRYAFAMRLRPGLADGAEMAAPWAVSTTDAAGRTVVERLSTTLRPLGVQGVRPLGGAEIAVVRREPEAAERLRAGGDRATDPLVREATCGWIGRQGVVAATITPLHPAFMRWLACR